MVLSQDYSNRIHSSLGQGTLGFDLTWLSGTVILKVLVIGQVAVGLFY